MKSKDVKKVGLNSFIIYVLVSHLNPLTDLTNVLRYLPFHCLMILLAFSPLLLFALRLVFKLFLFELNRLDCFLLVFKYFVYECASCLP